MGRQQYRSSGNAWLSDKVRSGNAQVCATSLSPAAIQDLQDLTDYLANIDLESAERLLTKFENKCQYLVKFPKIGRTYAYIRSDLRGLPLNGHIIFYRLGNETLEVLRVVKGNRDLEALFDDDNG
jgi:toxin ParE1/3/4